MRQQPEKAEQQAIVQLLRTLGASVYVLGTRRRKGDHPGTMQTPGIGDVYAYVPTHNLITFAWHAPLVPLWVEAKAPKGRLSKAQQQFKVETLAAGIPHLVGGIDVVTDWLRQGGWIK